MSRTTLLAYKTVDGLQYAVALVGAIVVVGGLLSYLATGAFVLLKWLLFLAGLLLLAAGVLKLRPTPAWRDEPRAGLGNSYEAGPVGAAVADLPPVGWLDLQDGEHLSVGGRLLLAGLFAWAVSFGLEMVLGVGVPSLS